MAGSNSGVGAIRLSTVRIGLHEWCVIVTGGSNWVTESGHLQGTFPVSPKEKWTFKSRFESRWAVRRLKWNWPHIKFVGGLH